MSLNKKCAFERSKNVDIFGGAPVNRETIIDKVFRSTRSRKRHGIFCKCVMINFKNEIFIIAP